jgi:hypothetical protein
MARLTPAELQAARVRSGKLGGRPRLPTPTEAREAALDRLVPGSLRALAAHLGTESEPNPDAWRAALKVLELRYGPPPPEPENVAIPSDPNDIASLSWQQMQLLAASLITVTADDDVNAMVAARV